ncbi:hypothetical protein M5000_00785 [Neisseria meningitidis]|nr:hypothetical protein [Neisseria meningitidis]MCL5695911.1 hypothetical protein [Neisseria meningitidis]MCL5716542.1 hypothetical protein [Neisseria meningitidis]MCL5760782.1 hypothetical protein [Neisseria meningitidis]MCL5815295.1 hypothetical protein [Neisseria meningitidis]
MPDYRVSGEDSGGIWVKLGGIWGENSRKPVLGFRLSGGKGILQRSQLKFAAGVLSKEMQELAGMTRATVWLSDDTLVKQVDSREGQNFDDSYYAFLPDMLQNPEHVIRDNRELIFTARYKGSALWAVLKYIKEVDEIYLQSYRISNDKEIAKFMAKKKVLK